MRAGALPSEPGQQVGTTGPALPGFAPAWLMRPVSGGPGTCLEVTVAAGAEPHGPPARTLRATLDYGPGAPSFSGRLAMGRRAFLVAAAGMAAGPYRAAAEAAARLIEAVFPDPSAVDARTRFATWLGVTSRVERPGELLAVKLYANLNAPGAPPAGGAVGLAARWPAWAQLARLAPADSGAEPRFAAVRVAATGALSYGLYVRPRGSRGHELLTRVSSLCGVDPNAVLAGVHESGLSRALWTGDMVVKVEAPEAGAGAPDARFAVHLAGAAAGGPDQAWTLVRPALRRIVGNVADTEELLQAATGGAPWGWVPSGIGLGFHPAVGHHATNVYLAPAASQHGTNGYLARPGGR